MEKYGFFIRPLLKLAVFLRCQLNPILNPSDTLNSKFPLSEKWPNYQFISPIN